jgi:hypothetical protein
MREEGNFYSNLTKDLGLKRHSLGSERMGQEGGMRCSKSGWMVF